MLFNTIFNNISVILWRSNLLVEETGVPGENHRPAASDWQTLSYNVVSSTPRLSGVQTHYVSGPLALVIINQTTIRSWPHGPCRWLWLSSHSLFDCKFFRTFVLKIIHFCNIIIFKWTNLCRIRTKLVAILVCRGRILVIYLCTL